MTYPHGLAKLWVLGLFNVLLVSRAKEGRPKGCHVKGSGPQSTASAATLHREEL